MLDRYGQPSRVLGDGIDTVQPSPTGIGSVFSLPNTANGTCVTSSPVPARADAVAVAAAPLPPPPCTFKAYGQVGRAAPKLPQGSRVLAHFADGTPAAVAVSGGGPKGGGAGEAGLGVLRLLWMPGMSWDHSGWLAGSGAFLRGILTAANATHRPAWTNVTSCQSAGGLERGIETPLLIDPGGRGAAMTLLNWCGGNVTVTATALVGFTVGSVTSAVTGTSLSFHQLPEKAAAAAGSSSSSSSPGGATVVASVSVADVDVLVFHPRKQVK